VRTAIVVAGGAVSARDRSARLHAELVIAADSGFDHADMLGLKVDVLVGDLDSISPRGLREAEQSGVEIQRHPIDKDQTDLELALDVALRRQCAKLLVLGSGGGRRDHELANVLLLASTRFAGVEIDAWQAEVTLAIVHRPRSFRWAPGDNVTLLPIGGPVTGIVTEGLRYPLQGETLEAGTSRGVSNVVDATLASISVDTGVLLVMHTPAGRLSP